MGREFYDDDCPGCRPVLLDAKTGQKVPDDDPAMEKINKVWESLDIDQRMAFHRVTCLNSRDADDIAVMQEIARRFQEE